MRIITNIIGTEITPLLTAAQYSALIGSIPLHAPGWRSSMRSLARATSYILRMRSSIWLQRGLRWTTSRKHSAWHGPGGLWVYASSCSHIGLIIWRLSLCSKDVCERRPVSLDTPT